MVAVASLRRGTTKRPRLLHGRYEPLGRVGAGGEGRVFRAFDHHHGRVVAIKIRSIADAGGRAAALAEARTLLSIEAHRNITVMRDDFFDGSEHVMVMDHVDGEDLRTRLHRDGRPGLLAQDVVRWLRDVAAALDHLHSHCPRVVHGDVKPANIVRRGTPGREVAVLVDFGFAAAAGGNRARAGTPGFAAPELARGHPTPATDIYSLAATAFALLTGGPPGPGAGAGLPQHAHDAVARGLALDPVQRPATAVEFVCSLATV